MHPVNRTFWKRCAERYPRYFAAPSRVIEFGSCYVNGTIRDYFTAPFYIGVDWREGRDVDVVSLAHKAPFSPRSFDTVVSASMLEHDPYWRESIAKMVEVMKPDGLLVLSWGAALNSPHEYQTAPDSKFHALPAGKVLSLLKELGVRVHEFQYEANIPAGPGERGTNGWGEAVLVGFGPEAAAPPTPPTLDTLLPDDEAI